MADDSPTYLTLSQVAVRTRRHPELLRQWCAAGRVPCLRLGGSWVVLEQDVALIDRIATRSRRRPRKMAQPSGRTRLLAAVFDDHARAETASRVLRERLNLPGDAIETAAVKLRTVGPLGLTFVAGNVPEEASLDGRRILTSFGGRIVAEHDGNAVPAGRSHAGSHGRRALAQR